MMQLTRITNLFWLKLYYTNVYSFSFQKPEYYIAAAGGAAYHNFAHIQQSIQDLAKKQDGLLKDINLKDCSREYGMLSLQGPKSKEILQRISNESFDNHSFPVSTNKWIEVAGHKVIKLRVKVS